MKNLLIVVTVLLSSCAYNITPRQAQIDYELDKAYLKYSYQRDSLIIEFYRTDIIEETLWCPNGGINWYTVDSVIETSDTSLEMRIQRKN